MKKTKDELYKVYQKLGGTPSMKVKKPRKGETWTDRIVREYLWRK